MLEERLMRILKGHVKYLRFSRERYTCKTTWLIMKENPDLVVRSFTGKICNMT